MLKGNLKIRIQRKSSFQNIKPNAYAYPPNSTRNCEEKPLNIATKA